MTTTDDRLLTPDEVCDRLAVSREALRRSPLLRRELRPYRIGHKTVRFSEADLLRVLARA